MINIKAFLNLTYYTSDLDQFLAEFSRRHPDNSLSQQQEQKKYAHIYRLRDKPEPLMTESALWKKF